MVGEMNVSFFPGLLLLDTTTAEYFLSLKASIPRIRTSQTCLTLTNFIEKSNEYLMKIYLMKSNGINLVL